MYYSSAAVTRRRLGCCTCRYVDCFIVGLFFRFVVRFAVCLPLYAIGLKDNTSNLLVVSEIVYKAPQSLVGGTGAGWPYQKPVEDQQRLIQFCLGEHFIEWKRHNTDKTRHPLFLAVCIDVVLVLLNCCSYGDQAGASPAH